MAARVLCAACGHPELEIFLDLGKTPLANKFPTEAELGQETYYPLQLGHCTSCHLVQMMEVIDDTEIYGDDYGFYSGGSEAQREYHRKGAQLLMQRHLAHRPADSFTVEIACNDGSLMKHFANSNYKILGVDPAGPAQIAIDAGLNVLQAPFTSALARQIRDENGPASLVIAYNSLAHVSGLSDILTGIWELLAEDGEVVVEVQYLPDLLAGNGMDQVYHEHRYFYSLRSFARAARLHRLFVIDAELIELQGGGIRITLSPSQDRKCSDRAQKILQSEAWLSNSSTYEGVQGRMDRVKDHLLTLIEDERGAGRRIAGYAAAAKATTILNYCDIGSDMLPFVIDSTPYKQGRYVPGTGIPIRENGDADSYLLLAPNYISHVIRANRAFLDGGGKWLIPLPSPHII